MEEVIVNGLSGFYIDWGRSKELNGGLFWINDDYVFSVVGNIDKNQMLKIAESAKIQ